MSSAAGTYARAFPLALNTSGKREAKSATSRMAEVGFTIGKLLVSWNENNCLTKKPLLDIFH
jgi:hypothetical protein